MAETTDGPYRSSGPLQALTVPPSELVYAPDETARQRDAIRRGFGAVWLGGVVSLLGAQFVGGMAALAWAVPIVLAIAVWRWRRARVGPRVVLRVEDGRLCYDGVTLPLAKLRDVRLETKTIAKLHVDRTIGAFVSTSVRPSIDVSRVVVVPAKSWGAPFVLHDDFEPNFEAVEWLGKIRRFVRAYGWLPPDERAKAPSSER